MSFDTNTRTQAYKSTHTHARTHKTHTNIFGTRLLKRSGERRTRDRESRPLDRARTLLTDVIMVMLTVVAVWNPLGWLTELATTTQVPCLPPPNCPCPPLPPLLRTGAFVGEGDV